MPNYGPRLSLPSKDLEDVIKLWAATCESMVVYEHEADEDVSTTHCHFLMINSQYKTEEALKRIFFKQTPAEERKGNALWAWEHKQPVNETFVTYMSKGRLRPVFVKNFSPAKIEELTGKWTDPVFKDVATRDKLSSVLIDMVIKRYAGYKTLDDYIEQKAYETPGASIAFATETLLKDVRATTMRCFWERTREAPHASGYKKVAGTAFLHICEKMNRIDEGLGALQNLWY